MTRALIVLVFFGLVGCASMERSPRDIAQEECRREVGNAEGYDVVRESGQWVWRARSGTPPLNPGTPIPAALTDKVRACLAARGFR
jgi:hypothetical protein